MPQNNRGTRATSDVVEVGLRGFMRTRQNERPWHAIDLAELKYGLAFGASVEEMADFLHRAVADVQHQVDAGVRRAAPPLH
jgi:hypothetical protein